MKITLKDGSVFEGTAQEYAELAKLVEGIAEMEECDTPNFEVGDYVVALPSADENYLITTTEMQLGEVREVYDDFVYIKIIVHSTRKGFEGDSFHVNSKYFRKATDEEVAKFKNEYIPEEGDIVVITGNTNCSRNKVGDIGKVGKNHTYGGVQVHVPERPSTKDANGNYTKYEEMRPATEEEKKQYKQAEKFAKLGRKPGEFKKGDLVRYTGVSELSGMIVEVEGDSESGRTKVKFKGTRYGICTEHNSDLELVAPVESRVDLDD